MEPIVFIILMALASNASAVTNKCTNANGKVIYTNTDCPNGYEAKSVGDNISVVDGSVERALIAKEAEQAKVQAVSFDSSGNEITAGNPATSGLTSANLAMIHDAESLTQTAITTRERLGMAIAILIGIAVIFKYFFRRKKRSLWNRKSD